MDFKVKDYVEFKDKSSNGKYSHDGIYIIASLNVRMKNPTLGEWVDAVAYYNSKEMQIFVREKQDFINKFKKVK